MIAALLLQRMSTKRRISAEKRAASRVKCDQNTSESVCCRTCLSTDNLGSIFSNSDEDKMSYNLKLVTGLEVCFYVYYTHRFHPRSGINGDDDSDEKYPMCYSRTQSIYTPNFI